MENICYIVGASEPSFKKFKYQKNDFIIACDKGVKFLEDNKMKINVAIGDFDSLGYIPQGEYKTIVLPKDKDITDLHGAIEYGIKKGYTSFEIYGCLDGRIDLTIATLQDVYRFKKNKLKFIMHSKDNTVEMLYNESREFTPREGRISILSLKPISKGVTLEGLKFPLKDAILKNDYPLGISNEFTNKKATISVKSGCLLLVY